MYKRIITYNFDNDDTRDSFVDLITGLGFEVQPDQSTYAQCNRNPVNLDNLKTLITNWSARLELSAADAVQIYFVNENSTVSREDMGYHHNRRRIE